MALEILMKGAATLGIELDAAQREAFALYLDLLLQANQSLNLTSLRDAESIERRHFLESLALGHLLEDRSLLPFDARTSSHQALGARVLDLGSGAGLPGIPLKIVWQGVELRLLEATAKKARFLHAAAVALQLSRTQILEGRAELLAHAPDLRGRFDLVTARAVAALPALIELALPFLAVGGTLAAVKGSRALEELHVAGEALRLCGGRVVARESLPGGGPLQLVLIEKIAETPAKFPRRPGLPAASPLGAGRGG